MGGGGRGFGFEQNYDPLTFVVARFCQWTPLPIKRGAFHVKGWRAAISETAHSLNFQMEYTVSNPDTVLRGTAESARGSGANPRTFARGSRGFGHPVCKIFRCAARIRGATNSGDLMPRSAFSGKA